MAFSDPYLEQRRTQILKGTSASGPGVSGGISGVKSTGFVDNSFEQRRKQVLSQPAPKVKVSATPTPTPDAPNFIQQVQTKGKSILDTLGGLTSQTEKKIQGLFAPYGQKSIPITSVNKPIGKIPELSLDQKKAIGTLKVGDKIPGFESPTSQPSASLKGGAKEVKMGNIIDNIFNKPADYLLNNTGVIGDSIKKFASNLYNNPVETFVPILANIEKSNPKIAQKIKEQPIYKFEKEALQGVMQGALRVYANWNPKVESFLDTELKATGKKSDSEIAGNTVGNVIGTIGGFVLGGEIVSALKFGRVALPATFAALGQTSLPSSTPIEARARNLIVDTVSGTLLEYIKPLANLQKLGMFEKGVEYTKQLSKSMSILSAQIYLDARSVGANNEQALEMVKDSALILLGLHGFMIAGKAGEYAVRSNFKEGTAVFTPEQARSAVVGSNLENTPLGKEIMKASIIADSQGKSLKIDLTAAQKSKIAGVLKLETPNGIKVTNIELVDPKFEPKLETPKQAETTPSKVALIDEKGTTPPLSPTEGGTAIQPREGAVSPIGEGIKTPTTFVSPVEEKAFTQLKTEPEKVITKYEKSFGNEVSPDLALTVFEGYSGDNAPDLIRAGEITKNIVYDDLIKTQQGEKNNTVLITAGGSGTGKTQSLRQGEIAKEDFAIVLDSIKPDVKDVQKALDNGYDVHISYVFRDPVQSWESGSLKRINEEGRVVSEADFVNSQVEAQKNIIKIYEKYKDAENVSFMFSKNQDNKLTRLSFNDVKQKIDKADVIKKVMEATDREFKDGRILEKQYKAAIKDRAKLEVKPPKEVNPPVELPITQEPASPANDGRGVDNITKNKKEKQSEVLGFNPKNLEHPFSKEATGELGKIVKQSEIAKTLSEKLGVPIRRGKFRHGSAIGIYKPGEKIVRIKKGGLDTIFHEVAHYLDDTIGFSNDIKTTERTNLMQEYGYSYEGDPGKQKKEAFAEYMRFKMTGQDEKIAQWAPEFDKEFNEKIKSMPDVKDVIDTATEDFKRWNAQPAVSKILSHISIGGQEKASFKDRAIQTLHDLYTSGLDDLHPLDEFSKLANKKVGKLDATADPYILARNLRGWVGKAELFLNNGTFRKDFWKVDEKGNTKMDFTGKSYSDIMKPVEKKHALDDFRVYIVAQRVVEDLAPRKIVSGISLEDAKKSLEELNKKYPEFEGIAAERRAYKDRLLEYGMDNGIIGPEGLAKIRELNKYHVPFYRVMEESGAKFLGKTKIAGNIGNPIKRIKGSEREIVDPLESDVKDTYAIINAAERNNIGIAMANVSKQNFELGRLFEEVAKPMKAVTVNVKEVLDKALKGTDIEGMEVPPELADVVVSLFRPTHAAGPNMLNVNMGDKQKVFEVDSDLFQAIQGLNIEDVGIIMKILSFPAKLLRAGATLSPDFSVRNPLRDQFTAFAYSKYGFIPGVDLVRGMFELFKKGETYNLWKAGGGEHAMFVSLDRTKLQEGLTEVLTDPNLKDTVVDIVKNPIKVLQILSEIGEAGTRLGEMRNALARGANPVEAAFASRNITLDFSRIGAKTRGFNAITAFFNANIQGTDTMIRNFKNRPFQTLWKVFLGMTLPSILLYLANRKDPRWKEVPQWQKDLFWIVMTPKHIWRIPKPFELGVLFGSVPERILEVMDTKDSQMLDNLGNTIMNGFTPGFMPTGLIPIIENITNYSFFLERPIVSPGKENLPPPQQAGPYTTEVSKILGEALNYSPAKIDNLVSGYGGGIGKYATAALDKILVGTGIVQKPPAPAMKFEELPVIKAFMIRPPIGTGSESVNRIYNMYQTTNSEMTYVKQLIKGGEGEKAVEYVKKHPDSIDSIILTGVVNTFSDLNKAVDLVRESDKLTSTQKSEKIDKIQLLQTEIAQKTLEQLKNKKGK